LSRVIEATAGSVKIIEECPCILANLFGLRMPFEGFEESPNVPMRDIE